MTPDQPREDRAGQEEAEAPSFTPASFEKRALAWMGLAYALMMLFTITFAIFTGGKQLPGTFPLLLLPAAVCAAVLAIRRYAVRENKTAGALAGTVLLAALFAAAAVFAALAGIPPLVYALQNAYN